MPCLAFGMARHGKAWQDMARHGKAWHNQASGFGKAWHAEADADASEARPSWCYRVIPKKKGISGTPPKGNRFL
jgi:hypothetical protein